MVSRIAFIVLLALGGVAARADLNLVPVASYYESEGMRFPNLVFRDGSCRVTYVPPPKWTTTSSVGRFTLYPPNGVRADAMFTAVNIATPVAVSQETTAYYESVASALLPRDATSVALRGSMLNPLKICGHATVEFVFDLVLFAQRYRVGCVLLPREHDRIQFMICAVPEHFDRLRAELHRSLYTFEGL